MSCGFLKINCQTVKNTHCPKTDQNLSMKTNTGMSVTGIEQMQRLTVQYMSGTKNQTYNVASATDSLWICTVCGYSVYFWDSVYAGKGAMIITSWTTGRPHG